MQIDIRREKLILYHKDIMMTTVATSDSTDEIGNLDETPALEGTLN